MNIALLKRFGMLFLCLLFQAPRMGWCVQRALVIGVTKYPKCPPQNPDCPIGAPDLPGASQEAAQITKVLMEKFYFLKDNIITLNKPDNTDRHHIEEAFSKLVSDTHPGDVVFISFSGHGSRVKDEERVEADGYDEVLVASDGIDKGSILDDEIDNYLQDLLDPQTHNAANVTLFIDSCNAGGADRGTWISRLYPHTPLPEENNNAKEMWTDRRRGIDKSRLDCFFGAVSGSSAMDLGYNGAFTRAFLKSVWQGVKCGELDAAIREDQGIRATNQTPYGEYSDPNRVFLGAERPAFPTYTISAIDQLNKTATLSAGQINGMREGTILAVYGKDAPLTSANVLHPPLGTDTASPLCLRARVRVVALQSTTCTVKLIKDENPPKQPLLASGQKALVLKWNYGDLRVPVLVTQITQDSPLLKQLEESTLLRLVRDKNAEYQLWVTQGEEEGKPVFKILSRSNGQPMPIERPVYLAADEGLNQSETTKAIFDIDDISGVQDALETYAQSINVRDLDNALMKGKESSVRIDLVMVKPNGSSEIVRAGRDGVCPIKRGSKVLFRVYNRPKDNDLDHEQNYKYRFGLLTVTPEGEIKYQEPLGKEQLLLPQRANSSPRIVGKESGLQAKYNTRVGEDEIFKFIFVNAKQAVPNLQTLSQKAAELRDAGRSGSVSAPGDPFGRLFSRALQGTRLGQAPVTIPPADWFTWTLTYRVVD